LLALNLEMPMTIDYFYESLIMTKSKPVANSQWIDWTCMENKYDPIFDKVIAACQTKHLRDILVLRKIGTMK
jgi:hypothetical protein